MKKIIFVLAITLTFITCKKEPAFVTFSGKITNKNGDKITIFNLGKKIKTFTVDENGVFSDTIKNVEKGYYNFTDGTESSAIYLKNGFNINLTLNTKEFDESIKYTGNGSDINNYLAKKFLIKEEYPYQKIFALDEKEFLKSVKKMNNEIKQSLKNVKNKDFIAFEEKDLNYDKIYMINMYEGYHSYLIKDRKFKVSDFFPKLPKDFSYDNDEDFKNHQTYQQIVEEYFYGVVRKEAKKDSVFSFEKAFNIIAINKIKNIDGEHIKNGLLDYLSGGVSPENEDAENLFKDIISLSTDEDFKKIFTKQFEKIKKLVKGKRSPEFINYDNFSGGTISLNDLKGKFVYIDVWATWCGPCKIEIPHLKKVEEKYHGKNIQFVSISIDKKKDYEKWRKMVKNKKLGGIQLFADNDWESDFVTAYGIEGIPRFILIDPVGKIVKSDAPRPSSPKLIKLFTENGI